MRKRNPRLDNAVQQAVAGLLETEFQDPRLAFVTVTEVQVSQDAREAIVYYTTLDPDVVARDPARTGGDRIPESHEVAAALSAARPRVQALLARQVRLRNTPVLRFEADPVADQAARVDQLLRDVRREDGS